MIPPKHLAWIFLICLGCIACNNRDWLAEKNFGTDGWSQADTLRFNYDNPLPGPKILAIQLEMDPEYSYRNIWLKLMVQSPAGDQQEIMIGDTLMDEAGNWYTDLSGNIAEPLIQTRPKYEFTETGTYQLKLIQFMREENLAGVLEVKLAIND